MEYFNLLDTQVGGQRSHGGCKYSFRCSVKHKLESRWTLWTQLKKKLLMLVFWKPRSHFLVGWFTDPSLPASSYPRTISEEAQRPSLAGDAKFPLVCSCKTPQMRSELNNYVRDYRRDRACVCVCVFQCSFGMLHEADRLRMDCPSCKKSTCCQCRSPVRHARTHTLNHRSEVSPPVNSLFVCLQWSPQHEGLSCQQFKVWQQQNRPDLLNTTLLTYNSIGTNTAAPPPESETGS